MRFSKLFSGTETMFNAFKTAFIKFIFLASKSPALTLY